jgi:hypothetical protein
VKIGSIMLFGFLVVGLGSCDKREVVGIPISKEIESVVFSQQNPKMRSLAWQDQTMRCTVLLVDGGHAEADPMLCEVIKRSHCKQ